jgi:hypothetical protein
MPYNYLEILHSQEHVKKLGYDVHGSKMRRLCKKNIIGNRRKIKTNNLKQTMFKKYPPVGLEPGKRGFRVNWSYHWNM